MASDRIRRNSEKIVILDTSAILSFFEFSIGFEAEFLRLLGRYSIVIPSTVIEELNKLSELGKGKKKINAKSALKLVKTFEVVTTQGSTVDDSIVNIAEKLNAIVFSNDKEIRKAAKSKGLKTIILRSKKYLVLEEPFV